MAGLARALGISVVAFGLAACGGDDQRGSPDDKFTGNESFDFGGLIGANKSPPDEFAVTTTKPLTLPKDFAALPPPTPGTRSVLQADPIAEARAALLGETEPQPANARLSASETALLSSTGGTATDPNISAVLDAEQAALEESRPSYALEGVFPSIRRNLDEADALTPSEERVRLSETLPQRTIGSTEIATIPTTATPNATLPKGATPAPVLPTVDPETGGELIYIPE